MRHFVESARPILVSPDQRDGSDDFPEIMRLAFDASHEHAEIAFSKRFGREPDYAHAIDVDTCWRLFLARVDARCQTAWEYGEGDEGAEEQQLLDQMFEHYRREHERARRDYIRAFLAEAGLPQAALAKILGVPERSVAIWKKGRFSDEDATVPDWLIVWCAMWLEAPEQLRRRITEQATADRWLPVHDPLPKSWVGRWSELLLSLPPDRQQDMLHHIRLIVA